MHASERHHPLLGDPKYGGDTIRYGSQDGERRAFFNRLFAMLPHPALHAQTLGFEHPISGETMHFEADPPEDWQEVLGRLRARSDEGA